MPLAALDKMQSVSAIGSSSTAAAVAVGAAAGALLCRSCTLREDQSSGKYTMYDGSNTIRWNQGNPRPLPDWAPAERKKHEELIRRAFALANEAVDNGNCPYAGRESPQFWTSNVRLFEYADN